MGTATNLNLQLKRLPAVLPEINIGMLMKLTFQIRMILVFLYVISFNVGNVYWHNI